MSEKFRAVIVDVDGTVADKGDRDPYDYSKVSEDTVIEPIRNLVQMFEKQGYYILFVSGREHICFTDTLRWLMDNDFPFDELHMREAGDYRPDNEIKEEIYRQHIAWLYDVDYVIDDRNKVVKMWRDLGLTVLQVAEGDF